MWIIKLIAAALLLSGLLNGCAENTQPEAPQQPKIIDTPVIAAPQSFVLRDDPAKPLFRGRDETRIETSRTNREVYAHFKDNPLQRVSENPISTFSIDVDSGSYSNVRRILNEGRLPRRDAVRVEEFINYFSYDYPIPSSKRPPFQVYTEVAPCPWNKKALLLHIGIRGYELPHEQLPPANLVFLLDVSGSMNHPQKLGLLRSALKLLSKQLTVDDRVSIVVYAGASGVILEPTAGNQTALISSALDSLVAGGSTNGGEGIRAAYTMAQRAMIENGINRVLLATDGDFNVGMSNFQALKDWVARQRKTGITLTTLGFGSGNYNDQLMEQLADSGDGNYVYIDTLNEARKVLVDELSATLQVIARDVKVQMEFNPASVAEYRLIGYENRQLAREDFANDKVDAGEIGAGHTVTALYEIALHGSGGERLADSRYQPSKPANPDHSDELGFLRLRYKYPASQASQLIEQAILQSSALATLQESSDAFRFAAAVAGFAQQLRGGKYLQDFGYAEITALAQEARGEDGFGYRSEFVQLVRLTEGLE